MSSDVKMQEWINDITDAVIAGEGHLDTIVGRSEMPAREARQFAYLIQQLDDTLTPVQPSEEFSRRLKNELIAPQDNLVWRIRKLPARVQMAAIFALFGGFVLLLRRRFIGEETREQQDQAGAFLP